MLTRRKLQDKRFVSINYKILFRSSLVIILSLVLCGITIFIYFYSIFQTQLIKDDSITLQQTADQLKYIKTDFYNFASVAVTDPRIQKYLKQYRNGNPVDQAYSVRYILDELATLTSLRNDIQDFAVITENGYTYWNDGSHFTINEDWYRQFQNDRRRSIYIKPTEKFPKYSMEQGTSHDTLLYVTKIYDYYYPNNYIGGLIFEIDLSIYREMIVNGTSEFSGFLWFIHDHAILYEKNMPVFTKVMPNLRQYISIAEPDTSVHVELNGGHYYINQSLNNNWILMAYTPKSIIFEKSKFILYFVISVIFVSIALIILLLSPVIRNITKPISQLNLAMNQLSTGNLGIRVNIKSNDEMENLGSKFNQMVIDLKNHIDERMELERNRQQMHFHLMVSQINPHFIYNTLNSIIYLARKQKYEDIIRVMTSFIHLLQDAIKLGESETFIPVKREMGLINDYVKIQKYRYSNIFELIWDVDPALMEQPIPKNILQPLVENALLHGIIPKEDKGTIRIVIERQNDQLTIIIEDDGVGIEPHIQESLFMDKKNRASEPGIRLRNIGLKNVRERLLFLYDSQLSIEIESIPGQGTTVRIRFPLHHPLLDRSLR